MNIYDRFFVLLGLVLSILHCVATVVCFFLILFAFIDRYEKYPETGEMTDAIIPGRVLNVLSFPLLLIGFALYENMPDSMLYVLTPLNSCLWGFGIALILKYRAKIFEKLRFGKNRGVDGVEI